VRIPKVYADLASLAKAQGWVLSVTRGGHIRWQGPDGRVVFSPASPSEPRGLHNFRSQLRHAGLRR
jgi:predicted RNA binding protein YcfA (HicA-like mRNA interferase family)